MDTTCSCRFILSTLRIIGPSNRGVWTLKQGSGVLKIASFEGSGYLGYVLCINDVLNLLISYFWIQICIFEYMFTSSQKPFTDRCVHLAVCLKHRVSTRYGALWHRQGLRQGISYSSTNLAMLTYVILHRVHISENLRFFYKAFRKFHI